MMAGRSIPSTRLIGQGLASEALKVSRLGTFSVAGQGAWPTRPRPLAPGSWALSHRPWWICYLFRPPSTWRRGSLSLELLQITGR
jgi:hypothetical protein